MPAELTLKLFTAHAVARRGEEIDGIEPANERRARIVQDRVSGRRDLEEAGAAGINSAVAQLVELNPNAAAVRAVYLSAAEPNSHDVLKAGFLIREAREELTDREIRRCGRALAHAL